MKKGETVKDYKELQERQLVKKAGPGSKIGSRYSSASKADILSRALEDVLEARKEPSSRSKVAQSVYSGNTEPVHKTYGNDNDSQAHRFRKTITTLKTMQRSGQVFADKTIDFKKNTTFGKRNNEGIFEVPRREGAFSINKKDDGVQYIDHKTKARKFVMENIS